MRFRSREYASISDMLAISDYTPVLTSEKTQFAR
jgi:hypothetical protein